MKQKRTYEVRGIAFCGTVWQKGSGERLGKCELSALWGHRDHSSVGLEYLIRWNLVSETCCVLKLFPKTAGGSVS